MASKNSKKNQSGARLERLRAVTGKTWDAVAADLGVKRAMLFHVLAGRRGFSEKTQQRLAECEAAAGIQPDSILLEQGLRGRGLIPVLIQGEGSGQSDVTIEDIDAGSKEVELEYRRGSPPADYPIRVKVRAPSNASLWGNLRNITASEDPSNFVKACIPELQNQPDLLDRITPSCYLRLVGTALDLTFGLNWRSKVKTGAFPSQ